MVESVRFGGWVPAAPEGTRLKAVSKRGTRIVNENPGTVAGADSGTHFGTNR